MGKIKKILPSFSLNTSSPPFLFKVTVAILAGFLSLFLQHSCSSLICHSHLPLPSSSLSLLFKTHPSTSPPYSLFVTRDLHLPRETVSFCCLFFRVLLVFWCLIDGMLFRIVLVAIIEFFSSCRSLSHHYDLTTLSSPTTCSTFCRIQLLVYPKTNCWSLLNENFI